MKIFNQYLAVALGLVAACTSSVAQTAVQLTTPAPAAASAQTVVPALVPYSGVAIGREAGEVGITFLIFKDEQGGEPLWAESQTVAIDPTGHYKVQLGAASPSGLPMETFSSGQARWLEIQIAGQSQQPRVLLTSVPYALKAADAATLGGLPASAFVLAASPGIAAGAAAITPDTSLTVTTTGGTDNYMPKFSGASTIVDSEIFDTGTSVGIGDVPNATVKLDVNGAIIMRGEMIVSRTGNATTAKGFPSYGFEFFSNAYNSSSKTNDNPYFQLQSEPTGNNTSAPSATFNLLFANNGGAIAETGFSINPNGTLNFAPGQTFPGTGPGTITGVTAGTGLTGGGTSGNVTLNLNTAIVPQLGAANTFMTTQTIASGDLNLPGTSSSANGVLNIGGVPFLHGYPGVSSASVFVGSAGNFTNTGYDNVGVGNAALSALINGSQNTASGMDALEKDTGGEENAAVGFAAMVANTSGDLDSALGTYALQYNTTGSENTAIGFAAGPDSASPALTNTTAIGFGSNVSQSNTLVLGQTAPGSPGADFVNVGIGTATPRSALEAVVNVSGALGPVFTLTNPGTASGTSAAIDFNTHSPTSAYYPGARIQSIVDRFDSNGTDLLFFTDDSGGSGPAQSMEIDSTGRVGIGTDTTAATALYVVGLPTAANAIIGVGADGAFEAEGIHANGGAGDDSDDGGDAAVVRGGSAPATAFGGDGIDAYPGNPGQSTAGYAGYFSGNVEITGTLNGSAPQVKIDDPVDPANKYLVQASVQSSEMMNIYSGNVVTDELGLATVTLPDWFESENTDFRYQLTVIGQFAQAIIGKKIANNKFSISTNAQHVEVSWQVTAVRQDVYAKAHPLVVEETKPAREQGFYIHPELYGQPAEKQTQWARHPQTMQRMKEEQEKLTLARQTGVKSGIQPQAEQPASAVNRRFAAPVTKLLKPVAALQAVKP